MVPAIRVAPASHPISQEVSGGSADAFDGSDCDDAHLSDGECVMDSSEKEAVYVKDGVAAVVARKERIMGRLSLIKQNHVIFLAWLPNSAGSMLPDGTFHTTPLMSHPAASATDRTLYAVHPIPLSEVKAIRKHAPSFGTQHVVLVLSNGLTLPPLYFTNGGVKGLFSALREHTDLLKSLEDPNTYLVSSSGDPLQQSLSGLLLDGLPPSASAAFLPKTGEQDGAGVVSQVWEGVSRMTALAKQTTAAFLEGSVVLAQAQPEDAAVMAESSPGVEWLSREAAREAAAAAAAEGDRLSSGEATTSVGVFELLDRDLLESATCARNAPRPPPLNQEEWLSFLNTEGRIVNEKALRQRVFYSGVANEIRKEVWKFLLGLYPMSSTAAERADILKQKRLHYGRIKAQWTTICPEQAAKFRKWRERRSRVEKDVRFGKWRERRSRVEKDVRRTDRAQAYYRKKSIVRALQNVLLSYAMYNFDLGYVQGMSDLAAPLLCVMRDEAEAFWCFACLMEKLEANFHTDCRGMQAQLVGLSSLIAILDPQLTSFLESKEATNFYFCYRWLLILFKREFSSYEEVMRIWEALWTGHVSPHFHIYMCAGVLGLHRRAIMDADLDFDGILRYCIQLSGQLDMQQVLRCAEKLCLLAGRAGQECLAAAGLKP